MNAFEKWQVIVTVIQTVILFGTLLVALYIGLKQTEISNRQAEISSTQTEISKAMLDIPFMVSVDVVYDTHAKTLNIYNKGQTNIFLWGNKLSKLPRSLEKEPRLITPGGFYYILAESIEADTLAGIPENGELRDSMDTYLTNQNGTKYVVTTLIYVQVVAGKCTVHTQTTTIKAHDWQTDA